MAEALLLALISASEKAACVARACKKEKELVSLLVQEKSGSEKNTKFDHDFKTLADVLIQETVRHDLAKEFPEIANNVRGEESASFTNTLGETVTLAIQDTEEKTAALLAKVLDNNQTAAKTLAHEVHADVTPPGKAEVHAKMDSSGSIIAKDIGIWIDPIDSTNYYIKGTDPGDDDPIILGDEVMVKKGLQVVTVLIGAYDLETGIPIMGVINQPFARYNKEQKCWDGRIYWGLHTREGFKRHSSSLNQNPTASKSLVMGQSEPEYKVQELKDMGYEVSFASGAGYKTLCVAKGWVSFYITSKGGTFKWDTCAGHAILMSLGGNLYNLEASIQDKQLIAVKYNVESSPSKGIEQYANSGGLLASFDEAVAAKFLTAMLKE